MLNPFNKVFTIVKNSIKEKCPNAGTSTDGSPSAFPYAGFKLLNNATTSEDLENNENAVDSGIEITVYSNKNITEANNIMSLACDKMRELGYQRAGPYDPKNVADTNIHRVIYRFDRVIGVDDGF